MPRYFFHVKDGDIHLDVKGIDLRDQATAKAQAKATMADILRDQARDLRSSDNWAIHVMDENGETVCRMRFITDSRPIGKVSPFQMPEATLH